MAWCRRCGQKIFFFGAMPAIASPNNLIGKDII
jgi:hypothetical protein